MDNSVALTTPIEQARSHEPQDRITVERSISQVPATITAPTATLVTLTMNEMVESVDLIKNAMKRVMEKGVDYGVVPGTEKPTLLKPGAEKLCVLFRLAPQYDIIVQEFEGGHREYRIQTTLIHINTGHIIGQGVGSCSTLESKYRYRNANRKCPQCGKEAIIKGKADYGGGWLCFKKKEGCGAKFADADPAIVGQEAGKVENPDIADSYNTVLKMAKKRSLIDATLNATAASAIFTQDVEDFVGRAPQATSPAVPNQSDGQQQRHTDTSNARPNTNTQPTAQVNGQAVPRHRTESGASAFQRSGPVMAVSNDRIDQLCRHFGIHVERVAQTFEKDGRTQRYNEFHVTGATDSLRVCIPSHILDACTRTKDQPRDKKRGLWIEQNKIAFLFEGLSLFFSKLDDHAKMITDRKPARRDDAPLPSQEPQMLPQYQDDDLPY